ncbi:hypothetical protein GCM10011309_27780 [Litorimonas cladophorae]|uniref:P/Homo B domain-containing protein n=1 Tax=Litorimonas cladophorae TaxID=1220491 RepID=A0A918KUF2_9PROT|nr:proprotein convertase P-domain-containing protein [Litorimonas cladophorae]GGX76129.1 hypothetical protein GCM10011309_27780 [Litorimonas cladophorae]
MTSNRSEIQTESKFCVPRALAAVFALAVSQGVSDHAWASPITFPATVPQAYGNTTPCGTPLTGTINVPDNFTITDLNVRFVASHTWRTDTNLSITSPNNTVVRLLVGAYGASLANYNVTFDDAAGVVVDTGSHANNQVVTGPGVSVRSESDLLSDFNGEDAQGNWTYSICDVYTPSDNGSMSNLSLIFDVPPDLDADKSVAVYEVGGYSLPGTDMIYTISATNTGLGTVDSDSMVLIDSIPAELIFYNGDMDDAGTATTDPVAFSETGSGLTLTYANDVGYSDSATRPTTMADCTYVPSAGYDENVKHICMNPKGEFLAGTPDPTFAVSFRAKLK